ncbi:MAG: hypothetical protein JKY88_02880 [Pseudomonadales bacterium]|nr:hypothetical protein [Pseudomonadales bacterium]
MSNNNYVLTKLTGLTALIYFLGSIISGYLAYYMISQVMLEENKSFPYPTIAVLRSGCIL